MSQYTQLGIAYNNTALKYDDILTVGTGYDEPSITYNNDNSKYDSVVLSNSTGRVKYLVVISGFANTSTYGVGDPIAFIENASNLAWTQYINEVGEAFFTIPQTDSKLALLRNVIDLRPHMQIFRIDSQKNKTLVWGGWLGEMDETLDDAIFYGYSYISGLYDLLTDWDITYTNQSVKQIVQSVWQRAKVDLADSRMQWISTGTIDDAVTTTGGGTPIVLPLYKTSYKRILTVLREMADLSISDTSNRVIFEITPSGVFNFWADNSTNGGRTAINQVYFGVGSVIRSLRRIRRPVDRRNTLQVVGTSPKDITLRKTVTDATLKTSMGRSEEPIYLQYVRDATEMDRTSKQRAIRAKRVDTDLYTTFASDVVEPAGAINSRYKIGDTVILPITNGASNITDPKIIVGQQVVYYRNRENVRLLLGDIY